MSESKIRDDVEEDAEPSNGFPGSLLALPGRVAGQLSLLSAPVTRLVRLVESLEEGMWAINDEFKAMRLQLGEVIEEVRGLRTDVQTMDKWVEGISSATVSLEEQIGGLSKSLDNVDALAARFGWLAKKRKSGEPVDPIEILAADEPPPDFAPGD